MHIYIHIYIYIYLYIIFFIFRLHCKHLAHFRLSVYKNKKFKEKIKLFPCIDFFLSKEILK